MEHYIQICCRYCSSKDLVKNGHSKAGMQRYKCKDCGRAFQWDYKYNAYKIGVDEQIESQTLNGSGIRDVGRNLQISKDTVGARLKKKSPLKVNPFFLDKEETGKMGKLEVEIRFEAEGDEFWSYVKSKANQRWTWYVIDRKSGIILAYHNGRRTDESCKILFESLSVFDIACYYTDDWQSYRKYIPAEKHKVGKDNTWKIERKNLNFRTHLKRLARKTICFSKSEEMHDIVIGLYINRYYFKNGTFSNSA
jgi:IS1 family transposase/DNA-directed RNA polymerase subunit RPC12/RpoP